jgi:hypothetical protein
VAALLLLLLIHPSSGSAADMSDSTKVMASEIGTTPGTQDSVSHPKSRADTVLVIKHSFNHRQQIITGSVVMSCLTLMLVIMNNYNPR